MTIRALEWNMDSLRMLDQRLLPTQEVWLNLTTHVQVEDAIQQMIVRGAPAIGVAAAYGLVLAARNGANLDEAAALLRASRPTAVNLMWAIDRMMLVAPRTPEALLAEAVAIEEEDLAMNHAIGAHGAELIAPGSRVLTICNTGSLATAGHGTALGVIRTAYAQGKVVEVFSCETRPRQQGLRLTAWELMKDGIPFRSIVEGAAGSLMRAGQVDLVIAGADRIAANGDTANKIGTYVMAVLARHHGIPFYIAAPYSTFDSSLADGSGIPIEERSDTEITHIEGVQVAPTGCRTWNPGFDVTPGDLITAIISEKGVHRPPYHF